MSAKVVPFPRRLTPADICREMAHTVDCSDPTKLAELLQESGFGHDPRSLRLLEVARDVWGARP